jgi:predicted transposase/invertase (TIGR01784 family)
MGEINKPHDKFFKETFGDLDVTTDFINHYLPKEILDILDLDTLTATKDSFIERDLRDTYSDLLFSVNINGGKGYFYFLFEHKSYQAPDIAFQLLGYMLRIWNQLLTKEKMKELPVVIPFIIYHGRENWESPKTIANWIQGYHYFPQHIQKCVPNYAFFHYDFSIDGSEEIRGNPKLQAYLQLSKQIFIRDIRSLMDTIITIENLLRKYPDYFATMLLYLLNTRDDFPIEVLKEELTKEGRKRLMSIAERLRSEGMQEGVEKGLEKGLERGLEKGLREGELKKSREMAKKLLHLNMDMKKIIEVTDLTAKEIEQIKKDM